VCKCEIASRRLQAWHGIDDTFPRPEVNDLRGILFWYSHEGFESQLPAVGARQHLCLCLAVPMSRQPTRCTQAGAHKPLLRPHSSLLTLRSTCAALGLPSVGRVINSLVTKVVNNVLLTGFEHGPCSELVVINTLHVINAYN